MSSSTQSSQSIQAANVGNWVLIKKLFDLFGYTDNAARKKMTNGVWLKGTHWIKAPDGHIFFNVKEITKWIES